MLLLIKEYTFSYFFQSHRNVGVGQSLYTFGNMNNGEEKQVEWGAKKIWHCLNGKSRIGRELIKSDRIQSHKCEA